jgi:hypothetical protein
MRGSISSFSLSYSQPYIAPSHQNIRHGRQLVEACLSVLKAGGVTRNHAMRKLSTYKPTAKQPHIQTEQLPAIASAVSLSFFDALAVPLAAASARPLVLSTGGIKKHRPKLKPSKMAPLASSSSSSSSPPSLPPSSSSSSSSFFSSSSSCSFLPSFRSVYVTIAQLQCLRVEEAVVAHEEKPHDPWPVEHFAITKIEPEEKGATIETFRFACRFQIAPLVSLMPSVSRDQQLAWMLCAPQSVRMLFHVRYSPFYGPAVAEAFADHIDILQLPASWTAFLANANGVAALASSPPAAHVCIYALFIRTLFCRRCFVFHSEQA